MNEAPLHRRTATASLCLVIVASGVLGCAARTHHGRPAAGYVPHARTAVKIAEAVWIPIYGERQIRAQYPLRAELRGDVWHVRGTLAPPHRSGWLSIGGTAEASIDRRTGKILRVSHGE